MEITVLKRRPFKTPNPGKIRGWVFTALSRIGKKYSGAGLLFCGPRTMVAYQKAYRGKDVVTDVLSFPGEEGYLGDIVVCVDQVRRQAEESNVEFEAELQAMVVHGVLHCAGFDHEKDRGEMMKLQREILKS